MRARAMQAEMMRRAAQLQAAANRPIRPRDVVVTKDPTVVKRGEETLTTLPRGADLSVLEVRNDWLGVAYRHGEEEFRGWVLLERVAPQRIVLQMRASAVSQAVAGVDWSTATMADDGRVLAYVVSAEESVEVVWNGQRGEKFDSIEPGHPLLSADGRQLTYGAERDGKWYVTINQEVRGPFESLACGHPLMNADGSLIVYVFGRDGRRHVAVNRTEVGSHMEVLPGTPLLSPDGKHYAYAARDEGAWRVYVDGREVAAFEELSAEDLVFANRGAGLACVGRQGGSMVAMVNGDVQRRHDDARLPYLLPGSGGLCYQACDDGRWFIVTEGRRTGSFDDVGDYLVHSEPSAVTYWARTGDSWQVVHDGRRGPLFSGYGHGSLRLSPNNQRLAYVGQRKDQAYVVVDGREYGPYGGVLAGTPVFDAQSQNVAYMALEQGTWQLYFNDRQLRGYDDAPLEYSLRFTPDGRLPLALIRRGERLALGIGDALAATSYYFPRGGELEPAESNRVRILAARGAALVRLEAEVSPRQ